MGPIHLGDYVGHDITLAAIQGWIEEHPEDPAFQVPEAVALLEDMVRFVSVIYPRCTTCGFVSERGVARGYILPLSQPENRPVGVLQQFGLIRM